VRHLLGLGALWGALAGGGEHHGSDRWIGVDKVQHFAVSFLIQSAAYETLRATGHGRRSSTGGAWLTTLSAGVGKELYDRHSYGLFSVKDLSWDVGGMAAASVALNNSRR
jgi:uncharacterized protein YfiM (DUF2279 family)